MADELRRQFRARVEIFRARARSWFRAAEAHGDDETISKQRSSECLATAWLNAADEIESLLEARLDRRFDSITAIHEEYERRRARGEQAPAWEEWPAILARLEKAMSH